MFRGQTVIVTGAGYGIGRAIARAFGREGANVVLAARSRDKLAAVADELRAMGTDPSFEVTDVTSEASVESAIAHTLSRYGAIDVLVNNAGIAGPTKLARDVSADEWNETVGVNLTGAFYCAKHVAAAMMARKRGCIVNIASVAGRMAYQLRSPYAASKWGLIGFSHSLAAELAPHGIRVNAVLPGATAGERMERVIATRAEREGKSNDETRAGYLKDVPMGRMITEAEVAEAVLFLASDAASGLTGQAIAVDGGYRMQ